jgi:hypothetical protein
LIFSRSFLISATFASGAAFCLLSAQSARADEAITAGVVPYSFGAVGYPNAFTGIGLAFNIAHTSPRTGMGFSMGYQSQGSGDLIAANFKYYFKGMPQMSTLRGDATVPFEMKPKTWGAYFDGGPVIYRLSQLGAVQATFLSPPSTAGIGMNIGVGIEYPLFIGLFGNLKASYIDSLGGPLSTVVTEVTVGFPFHF